MSWLYISVCMFFAWAVVALVISVVLATARGEVWYKPIQEWVPLLHDWFRLTPEVQEQRALQAVWQSEDHDYAEQVRLSGGPVQRKELITARKLQLKERAATRNAIRGYTWGSMFSFLLCLCALPPVLVASYYLKIQVAREFLVGSADLVGLQIVFLGIPFQVHTTDLVATGLILLEVVGGVVLSHANDRLWQIKSKEVNEPERRYQVLQGLAWIMMVALILLEGGLGVFRGQLEAKGEMFATIWMVGISVVIPTMTMVCSFIIKSQISHVAGPITAAFWSLAFVVVILAVGPSMMLAWLVLVGAYAIYTVYTNWKKTK